MDSQTTLSSAAVTELREAAISSPLTLSDPRVRAVVVSLGAALLGLLVGALLIRIGGADPLAAAATVLDAGFSCRPDRCDLLNTLALLPPLGLCALAGVVVLRSGMFSIGQEGQYAVGGVAAGWVGYALPLPGVTHLLGAILAAVLAGALWALVPALLKVRFGVNELICSIIFNNIAILLVSYLISFPMRADRSSQPFTPRIERSAQLPVFDTASKVGVGVVVVVTATVAVWFLLFRTTWGYEQRMTGEAPAFGLHSGMAAGPAAVRAMLVSGGIAGLAGAVQVLGVNYRVVDGFADGTGFNGLTAALLGGLSPVGALVAAFAFAGISTGAVNGLQVQLGIPSELGGTVFAVMIVLVALRPPVLRRWQEHRRRTTDGTAPPTRPSADAAPVAAPDPSGR
ncbi:ABC transporter permease [Pseudonocardia sp. Ae707_Ps2]